LIRIAEDYVPIGARLTEIEGDEHCRAQVERLYSIEGLADSTVEDELSALSELAMALAAAYDDGGL
jgi:hypothetical protein